MKVDVHDRLEAVGADAWDALHAATRLRSPFLSWTWQREWARSSPRAAGWRSAASWTATGQLVALLPLWSRPRRTSGCSLGGADVSDYLDLIVLPRPRGRGVGGAARAPAPAEPAVWELHAVPAASPTVTALPGAGRGVRVVAVTAWWRSDVRS